MFNCGIIGGWTLAPGGRAGYASGARGSGVPAIVLLRSWLGPRDHSSMVRAEGQMTVQAERSEEEVFSYQAEAAQVLDLVVHSLYSNKDIFLRELISNASDAIDRLRLELLSHSELPGAEGPLQIRVGYDQDARTIT